MDQHDPTRQHFLPSRQPLSEPNEQYPAPAIEFRQPIYQTTAQAGPSIQTTAPHQLVYAPGIQYAHETPISEQYVPGYGDPDPSRQQRRPQPQVNASSVYHGLHHPPTQSPFHQMQQFRTQSGEIIETLPNQYNEPSATQYYTGTQPRPDAATPADYAHNTPALVQYPQHTYAQAVPSASASYPGAMFESSQHSSYQNIGQPQPLQSQFQYQQAPARSVREQWSEYDTVLRRIFTNVRDRVLEPIPRQLEYISELLIRGAETLEMTIDVAEQQGHDSRIQIWDNFNRAWLTTLQRQFDMTAEVMTGRSDYTTDSLLDAKTLEKLADTLIGHCDHIQKVGLVDYQMGVAEEEILDILMRCLTQLETIEEQRDDPMDISGTSVGQGQRR